MRYWFDILTPKQLLFFRPVIEGLQREGHEVLATSRNYREVEQLASLLGLDLTFVGARGGKDPLEQFELSLERMEPLLPMVVGFSPDVSVSVASADCARISFGLRVKHVAVNDSPHSLVAGKLSLPLSHHLHDPVDHPVLGVVGLRPPGGRSPSTGPWTPPPGSRGGRGASQPARRPKGGKGRPSS